MKPCSDYRVKRVRSTRFDHCRTLDMTLDEIRLLLRLTDAPGEDCGEVNALLEEHIGHVDTRIRELRQLEKQLRELREQCARPSDAAHCGILNQLKRAASAPRALAVRRRRHVEGSHGGVCIGGHFCDPYEQKTQQWPGSGLSSRLQPAHSWKNRQASVGMVSLLA